jgi:hypothetical protein
VTEPPKDDKEGKDWAEFAVKHEEVIGRYIDRIAGHIFHATTEKAKHREILNKAQGRAALAIVTGVLLLFAVALFLTYTLVASGRLSGETFVFFIGALLGSLFTLLAERVVPLLYPAEDETEP